MSRNPAWDLPVAIGVLVVLLAVTGANLFGALGRVSILREQIEDWRDSTEVAHEATQSAVQDFERVVMMSSELEEGAVANLYRAQVEVDRASSEAEASFRRAEALAEAQPELEQAIQEMRATSIVVERAHEAKEAESAAALFQSQQQIRTLTTAALAMQETFEQELFTVNTSLSLALQTIEEQQNAIVPSFFRNLFQNMELAVVSAVVGGTIVFVVTR